MSSIENVIFRAVALWIHVGIGPLFGCGPMEACRARPMHARKSAVSGTEPQPSAARLR